MRKQKSSVEAAPTPLPEKLWNVEKAMEFLDVSRTKLYYLMAREGLPHIKLNRMLRFDENDIAQWLREHKVTA